MLRIIALFTILATPVAAQDAAQDKELLCNTSGEIVGAGVAERLGGADEETAIKAVQDWLTEDKAKFKPAVEPLVQWVYTLEADQLTEEAAKSYVLACLTQ
ncbi:DNA primase [uncultured Roseovarius sp.]|uniref:DNA primase n=1 Tax=uncultured Roseovarius sp. TaxID=293344 RepID=UPI002628DC3D|nr:DNA primase [uncultured Roseovarius sp.]